MRFWSALAVALCVIASLACCFPSRQEQPQPQPQIVAVTPPQPIEPPAPPVVQNPPLVQPKLDPPQPVVMPQPPPQPKIDAPPPQPKVVVPTPPPSSSPPSVKWAIAFQEAVIIGSIKVRVVEAHVDQVDVQDFRLVKSKNKVLKVTITIENVSESKLCHYKGWGKDRFGADPLPRLDDNFGNRYPRIHFGLGSRIVGQQQVTAAVHPGRELRDLIVFERPIDRIAFLRLELPAAIVGEAGSFRFEIPLSVITGDSPQPAKVQPPKLSAEERAKLRAQAEAEAAAKNKANREAWEAEVARMKAEHAKRVEKYQAAKKEYDAAMPAYQKAKAEYDAAKALAAARLPPGATANLKEVYRRKWQEIVKEYPETGAAKDAKKLLKGGFAASRAVPPEPERPVLKTREPAPLELPAAPEPVPVIYPPD